MVVILIFVFDTCEKSSLGNISDSNFEKIVIAEDR